MRRSPWSPERTAPVSRRASPELSVTVERLAAVAFAVMVCATVVALAVTQKMRSGAPILDEVAIGNELRPPERIRIRFRLTEDEPAASVEIIDRLGEPVATLAEDAFLGDYEIHRFTWRGRGSGGSHLSPGVYRVRVRLETLDRTIVLPGMIKLRRRAPAVGESESISRSADG